MSTEKVNTVRVFYGPRVTEKSAPSKTNMEGKTQELVIPFNFDDLPGVELTDAVILSLPAGSYVKAAYLFVDEAFTGGVGAAYDIGLSQPNGTPVDLAGLYNDVLATSLVEDAALEAVGALVGTIVPVETQVVATATGVFTAGKGRLIVEYIK